VIGPRARLALLVAGLAALYVAFAGFEVVSRTEVERVVAGTGVLGPLVFMALSAVLGALLLPGPLLSAASGLLFGTALGFVVTLGAAVLSALLAHAVGRLVARRGAVELISPGRQRALEGWLERRGLGAVVVQRLIPGIPDGPVNYVAGALGVRRWHLAAGTAIGSAPRTFAYAALGDSLDDLTSPLALLAIGVLLAAFVVGLALVRSYRP
jgi:uncharacterized membrane protein YdjX (TVP38/TMEM64 family)